MLSWESGWGTVGKCGKLYNCVYTDAGGGLSVGGNDCMHVNDSSVHCCGCVAYGSLAMVAC